MTLKSIPLLLGGLFLSLAGFAQEHQRIHIPGSDIDLEMVLLPGGQWTYRQADGQQQTYVLDSFLMATHELTYDAWALFQIRENDSDASALPDVAFQADAVSRPSPPYLDFANGMGRAGGYPAVSMTQQAALRYCQWLYQKTGRFFRLPTEAEWTYACQANQDWQPEDLADYSWYYDNSFEKYHIIAEKKPNPWGLYDMLGNVAEWTLDFYEENYLGATADQASNPWVIPLRKHSRTVKGGSYDSTPEECTCTHRLKSQPKWQARDPQIPKSIWWNPDSPFVGFRLLSPLKQPSPEEIETFFQTAIKD
ncbi:MAG TPA: SUMF1/EgtB/PvdO family nonheme iron enzyme [Saprospiraceae bacterium]|nr:SUMF1/EgtB/PvdO family nonheme iron enzyme [Saprospiraceae bacterium]HMQ84480.1 SUMF1/EgtB/PvdO family nonheme iron enzyme [Saprospiraceae bacterium]